MPTDPVVIVGGTVLAAGETIARQADIVLNGDCIAAVVPPGAADAAQRIDATGRLIIPGLINAHTHGHGGLGKGIGDLWSLELLLNAGPWINGNRTDEDRYLSTLLSAVEMLRKGCTSLLRSLGDAAGAVGRRAARRCTGLCRCRHARGDCTDDRRPQLLSGNSRSARRLPAGVASGCRSDAHRIG